jgi:predicted transcriptional regulator
MSLSKDEASIANASNSNLTGLTADIVSAYVSNHVVPTGDLGSLIAEVHKALQGTSATSQFEATEVVEKQKPAVNIRKSVSNEMITCLDCGSNFKSLKRHLMTHHSMSPEEYRAKWNLGPDYPMVSPEYSQARSQLAKTMGLGQTRGRSKGAAGKAAA